ncbi:uncharacterized protein At4g14450, chloroplastic-like [Nicotiana sylvestris]|uniref:Uncharacterized protein At4g14450, chloroplastic-like n=1 Tax=Nicotiana sylvestris TaxID=4096 RepID=A0A1U7WCA6_NICSY|nr:PREDICTED: uncharacterized protein At4g14450, chloroplastic-like [Nicotiana sylvestris]
MSNNHRTSTGDRRNPSRLQLRAPASIQINRASDWNVAIPLLSPLITSPTSPDNLKSAINRFSNSSNNNKEGVKKELPEKPVKTVFKKWQHPAAPFCHEPAAPLFQFVCTGTSNRR